MLADHLAKVNISQDDREVALWSNGQRLDCANWRSRIGILAAEASGLSGPTVSREPGDNLANLRPWLKTRLPCQPCALFADAAS